MRVPALEAAALRAGGLPCGPLAEPLPYWQAGAGKLHARHRCQHLRGLRAARAYRHAGTVTADELCRTCTVQLPGDAEAHVTVGRALLEVQVRTAAAAAVDATWFHVARMHVATEIAHRLLEETPLVDGSLADAGTRILTAAAAVREHARSVLPAPAVLTGPPSPTVVLYTSYHPRSADWASSSDVVAAAAPVLVRDLRRRFGYSLAACVPTGDASYLRTLPATPGDGPEVFRTALVLVDEVPASRTAYGWELTQALEKARLIHAPAGD